MYLVAGEASGDILGDRLIRELLKEFPDASFKGIGGPLMIASGLESVYPMERLSVMGIIPIIKRLVELLGVRRRLAHQIVENKASCLIGIDAPVFNTQLEFMVKRQGIKTVHYVSPSVWAWRENRIYKIVKSVSLMICLFPFELDIYKKHNLPAISIGHPLAEEIPLDPSKEEARTALGIDKGKVLAILPGSRGSEMNFLLAPFLSAAQDLNNCYEDMQLVMPCANSSRRKQAKDFIDMNHPELNVKLIDGRSRDVMQASDVVLLASGTATLEAMLLKRPMLVCYKVSSFSYWIYSKLLKIRSFSLPNLLANKKLVTELIQTDCTADKILIELKKLLHQEQQDKLISEYKELHKSLLLGGSKKAAIAIASLIKGKNIDL
ncbi:MAG: lipid-A-disaccharide synthase [Kangiellaceae bacterium]|nr:lipid-A-disaccharide synthase [Kangiellaceae bacterium]